MIVQQLYWITSLVWLPFLVLSLPLKSLMIFVCLRAEYAVGSPAISETDRFIRFFHNLPSNYFSRYWHFIPLFVLIHLFCWDVIDHSFAWPFSDFSHCIFFVSAQRSKNKFWWYVSKIFNFKRKFQYEMCPSLHNSVIANQFPLLSPINFQVQIC